MSFIYFSCLISVARTSNTMLNKSDDSGHFYLVPNLKRKAFSFSALSVMLVVGLSYMAFIMLGYIYVPYKMRSIFTLLRIFNHK